jgi:DNA repair exonuclease SbcCD nuclease subunit
MRILVYGDIHLSTKNRAKHRSYPDESLYYFRFITEQAENLGVDCIIGLGDLSYGNFSNLKFREIFEELLDRQIAQTKGERYELRGNHDISNSGYSEYDFYVSRNKIRPGPSLIEGARADVYTLGYGDAALYSAEGGRTLEFDRAKKNIVMFHDFLRFKDSRITGYGDGYIIEELPGLKNADWFIGGHIHDTLTDTRPGGSTLFYPGALARPTVKGGLPETGAILTIDTDSDDSVVQIYEVSLLPVEESFDLQRVERVKAEQIRKTELKLVAGELHDAVRGLAGSSRRTALDIIRDNVQISAEVRDKAIEYLVAAGAYPQ